LQYLGIDFIDEPAYAVPSGTRSFPSSTRHFRCRALACSVPAGL